MAQRSITSFFSKGPASTPPAASKSTSAKSGVNATEKSGSPLKADTSDNVAIFSDEDTNSPIKVAVSGKKRRRARVISSSDEDPDVENGTPPKSDANKTPTPAIKGDAKASESVKNSSKRRSSVDASESGPKSKNIKAEENDARDSVDDNKKDAKKSVTPKSTKKTSKKTADKKSTPKSSAKQDANNEEVTPKSTKKADTSKSSSKKAAKSPKDSKAKKASPKNAKKATEESDESGKSPAKEEEKADEVKQEREVKKESPKKAEVKKESPKKAADTPKAAKNPFAAMMGGGKNSDKTDKDSKGQDNYDEAVKKSRYHPIDDACWARGDKTPYLAFAKTLQAIEATSGRLKTIEILANYFRSVMVLTPDDLLLSVYLCLNRLAPAYEGIELGIGETLLVKAIAQTTGRSVQQIKADVGSKGDLGIVAETSRGTQRTMFKPAPLTVPQVFKQLKEIAEMTGHSCMNKKTQKIQSMLVACRQSEARYLIRSLAGKLRIGLAEQSVLQALAHACVMTPPVQSSYPPEITTAFKDATSDKFKEELDKEALKLKTAYCECPCYDQVIPVLLAEGIDGVAAKCKLTPGIPLKPMLAHPTKGVGEVLQRFGDSAKFTCEWKYDGERAQIHLLENGTIKIYSRNQEDNTSKYPDIIQRFANCKLDNVKTCVIDSEAVAWDREKKQIQPFQVLSTRKRKDAAESEIKVQVAVFAFDCLYLNGEALVTKPFQERRALLRSHFKEVEGEFLFAKSADPDSMDQVQELLEDSVKENCEGLMVKTLEVDATYEIAKRSHNWLKLKKDYLEGVGDTLDVVVMGGYFGKGKRTGIYGGFLLGCYDPENEEYQSLCKIGTGFSDEDLKTHHTFFQDHKTDKAKSYFNFESSLAPDQWFEPVQVWEIKAADLSVSPVHRAGVGIVDPDKGISLRFPRFIRIRDDKTPEDATTARQVADMYNSQEQVKNQKKQAGGSKKDDDFDF